LRREPRARPADRGAAQEEAAPLPRDRAGRRRRHHQRRVSGHEQRSGTRTVVATPLGNLEDLSPRAARALREAELIVAEDTRSARRLLAELGITPPPPIVSCFDANEEARAAQVADRLRAGARVALISEAGTPLVSDPGY